MGSEGQVRVGKVSPDRNYFVGLAGVAIDSVLKSGIHSARNLLIADRRKSVIHGMRLAELLCRGRSAFLPGVVAALGAHRQLAVALGFGVDFDGAIAAAT